VSHLIACVRTTSLSHAPRTHAHVRGAPRAWPRSLPSLARRPSPLALILLNPARCKAPASPHRHSTPPPHPATSPAHRHLHRPRLHLHDLTATRPYRPHDSVPAHSRGRMRPADHSHRGMPLFMARNALKLISRPVAHSGSRLDGSDAFCSPCLSPPPRPRTDTLSYKLPFPRPFSAKNDPLCEEQTKQQARATFYNLPLLII
jgi:hypothetical protein